DPAPVALSFCRSLHLPLSLSSVLPSCPSLFLPPPPASGYPICAPLHPSSCLSPPCSSVPPSACLLVPHLCVSSSLPFSLCFPVPSSTRLWAPHPCALPPTSLLLGPTTTATLTWGSRLAHPVNPYSRPAFNPFPAAAMSNNMAKIAEARKTVEQLKLEVNIDRMKVSQAAAELLSFCETHAKDDPLVTPVPAAENPFRDKRLFCVLL
uniref:Guanine nucleotide-binding protein subunit gamma n=5 Tax=Boreoeutheria TaxID=1437010 RepID=A0A8C4L3Y6_EQUAS